MNVLRLLACSVLLAKSTTALKPVPFESMCTHTGSSSVKLVSTQTNDGVSTEGESAVFGRDGEELYRFPQFTGRRNVLLGSNGSVAVFDGNIYFGTSFLRTGKVEQNQVVSEIYLRGRLWKEVQYADDLNDGKEIEYREEDEIGGGWIPRDGFIRDVSVNWDRNVLVYDMVNGESIEIVLPLGETEDNAAEGVYEGEEESISMPVDAAEASSKSCGLLLSIVAVLAGMILVQL